MSCKCTSCLNLELPGDAPSHHLNKFVLFHYVPFGICINNIYIESDNKGTLLSQKNRNTISQFVHLFFLIPVLIPVLFLRDASRGPFKLHQRTWFLFLIFFLCILLAFANVTHHINYFGPQVPTEKLGRDIFKLCPD